MKQLFLVLMLFPLLLFGQGDNRPANIPIVGFPYPSGSDTLIAGASLESAVLPIGTFNGAISLALSFTALGDADSLNYIDVYWKERLSGMAWGVPHDSIAVDSIHLGRIDSTSVKDGRVWNYKFGSAAWWGFTDQGQITLVAPAAGSFDSALVKCRLRGQ